MEEYSSKRAQAIQAKELAAKENEVRNIKNTLSQKSIEIESMIVAGKDITTALSHFESALLLLKSLAPTDAMIISYEAKPIEWAKKIESKANKKGIEECIEELENSSEWINRTFVELKELSKIKKKKSKHEKAISECKESIASSLFKLENCIARLENLDKQNSLVSHYRQKFTQWNTELNNVELGIHGITGTPISFPQDAEQVKATLTKLAISVDSKIKSFCSGNGKIKSDVASFENGLAVLHSVDSDDSMISYYDSKLQEWKLKMAKAKKTKIFVIVGSIVLIFLLDYI